MRAAEEYLHLDQLQAELARLADEVAEPELWQDADRARQVTTAYGRVKSDIDELDSLRTTIEDAALLLELAEDEGEAALGSLRGELEGAVQKAERALDDLELRSLFSGEHDERDAIAEIHGGAGGTDAQDWAEMMLRMYLRWAERRGLEVELDEVSSGGEAGILSATFVVRGRFAYGLLAAERGVHRLVRMSPFDAQHRRQTSFASFDVTPFLDELAAEVDIDEKDLRVDTYRSSGAGGQHVNVTDSAVRLTHLPTGIVVSCQNERSQHQNKARAMQILAAKLIERQRAERLAELSAISGPQSDVAWGSQIRSYVMAPYQLVKDLRTGYETGNVEAVLDGDLDGFMTAYLRWRRGSEQGAATVAD
jgi:peptide chain release factor 2